MIHTLLYSSYTLPTLSLHFPYTQSHHAETCLVSQRGYGKGMDYEDGDSPPYVASRVWLMR